VAAVALGALAVGGWAGRRSLGEAGSWAAAKWLVAAETVEGWATRLRALAATVPEGDTVERVVIPGSRSVLVVLGEEPGACAFALAAASPDGALSLTLLPPGLAVVIPGYGDFTLGDSLAFEGPGLAALTVTNALGVRVDFILPLVAGDLARAVSGPLSLDLPVALFTIESGGPVQVLGAGRQQVSPSTLETLLVTAGTGDAFEWLQRQGAAWRALLDAVAADPTAAGRLAARLPVGGQETADLLSAVAGAGDLALGALPVERVATPAGEALALSSRAEAEFVAARLGHLLLLSGERPRVEVLNGNGRIGATRVVAEAVVRRGFRVVRTDNADRFDYAATLVVAHGTEAQEAARRVAGIVGVGAVYLEEASPSPGVEVSIIVGLDIPAGEA